MLRQVTAGLIGLAGVAFAAAPALAAGPVGQIDTKTYGVQVNVNVLPTVSVWSNTSLVTLNLDGTNGPEDWAAVSAPLTYISNVLADLSFSISKLSGDDLPSDAVYWLFHKDLTSAVAYLQGASPVTNAAAGAFRFSGAQVNTGVATTEFVDSLPIANAAASIPVVYAADLRNSLPPPSNSQTVVTWTIAPHT
jgi:hypothetical protein